MQFILSSIFTHSTLKLVTMFNLNLYTYFIKYHLNFPVCEIFVWYYKSQYNSVFYSQYDNRSIKNVLNRYYCP